MCVYVCVWKCVCMCVRVCVINYIIGIICRGQSAIEREIVIDDGVCTKV